MSDPANDIDPAEIKKSYSEAVTRATRFLISSAIILFILIVIVGQELREYRTKQANFAKQIRTTLDEKKNEEQSLQALHRDICRDLRSYVEEERFSNLLDDFAQSLRNTTKTRAAEAVIAHEYFHATGQLESDYLTPQEPGFDITFGQLISGCSTNSTWKKLAIKERPFPRRTGGVRTQTDVDALARDETKLAALIDVLKQDVEKQKKENEKRKEEEAKRAKNKIQKTEALIKNMAEYRDAYRRVIDLMRDLLNLAKESKSLNAAKNSIPTPFGNFQIAPRLALLGLAYASLFVYLSFLTSVRKIRTLADRYSQATGEPSGIPTPLWSPTPSSEATSDQTSGWTRLASVLVHFLWLSTAAWLTFECVFTWNAPEALAFAYKPFWGYLLLGILITIVLVFVWVFLPTPLKRVLAAPAQGDTAPRLLSNRRVFIGFGGAAVVGLLTLGVRRLFGKGTPKLTKRTLSNFTSDPNSGIWIQNKRRNRIVHAKGVCDRHLPADHNRLSPFEGDKLVHAACHSRIFELLGYLSSLRMREEISEKRTEPGGRDKLTEKGVEHGKLALEYFKKAIALKPLSLHLYDELRRVYGTLELYDEIPKLFEESLKMVQHETTLAKATGNLKRLQSLRRTEQAFKLRLKTTEKRRNKAAERKNKKQYQSTEQRPLSRNSRK